jgi:DNA polymerase III delta subunit
MLEVYWDGGDNVTTEDLASSIAEYRAFSWWKWCSQLCSGTRRSLSNLRDIAL